MVSFLREAITVFLVMVLDKYEAIDWYSFMVSYKNKAITRYQVTALFY